MKSTLLVVAASAILASAGPIAGRALQIRTETDWVTQTQLYYVTVAPNGEGSDAPTPQPAPPPSATQSPDTSASPSPTANEDPTSDSSPSVQAPPPTPEKSASYNPPKQQSGSPAGGSYQQVILDQHNTFRAQHPNTPNLQWNSSLAGSAEQWAHVCEFKHSVDGYGQNLAMESGGQITDATKAGSSAVTNWYNEKSKFAGNYGQSDPSTNFEAWGHFTQVIWKSTRSVGCVTYFCNGNAPDPTMQNAMYTVCNYYPAGNFQGEYAQNVLQA